MKYLYSLWETAHFSGIKWFFRALLACCVTVKFYSKICIILLYFTHILSGGNGMDIFNSWTVVKKEIEIMLTLFETLMICWTNPWLQFRVLGTQKSGQWSSGVCRSTNLSKMLKMVKSCNLYLSDIFHVSFLCNYVRKTLINNYLIAWLSNSASIKLVLLKHDFIRLRSISYKICIVWIILSRILEA